jgi:hypothetical protein
MDRSEINRCLAKALAYKACGKDNAAIVWAARLIGHLELAGILDRERVSQANFLESKAGRDH